MLNIIAGFTVKQEEIIITDEDDDLPLLQELPDLSVRRGVKNKKKRTLFRCDQCPRRYNYKVSLKRHKGEAHEGQRRFQCPYCEYKCARKYYLTKHISVHEKYPN